MLRLLSTFLELYSRSCPLVLVLHAFFFNCVNYEKFALCVSRGERTSDYCRCTMDCAGGNFSPHRVSVYRELTGRVNIVTVILSWSLLLVITVLMLLTFKIIQLISTLLQHCGACLLLRRAIGLGCHSSFAGTRHHSPEQQESVTFAFAKRAMYLSS